MNFLSGMFGFKEEADEGTRADDQRYERSQNYRIAALKTNSSKSHSLSGENKVKLNESNMKAVKSKKK